MLNPDYPKRRLAVAPASIFFVCFMALHLGACVAPPSNYPSARSVGKGNHVMEVAVTGIQNSDGERIAVPTFRVLYGLDENLDVAVESVLPATLGIGLRYSLLNPKEDGLAWAVHGGFGTNPLLLLVSSDSSYFSLGSTVSYQYGAWEPFVVARFDTVRLRLDDPNDGNAFFDLSKDIDESYSSLATGLTWWSSSDWGLYGQVSFLTGFDTEFDVLDDFPLFTVGAVFR
jgi:hypothetical protein